MVVEAGATWSDVLARDAAAGQTPPVLTEYLELSVGGTLAVGGVGGTTSTFGVQSDNVIELEVVTGEGKSSPARRASNADLFDAVRAGLGQVGVITRATLELVAAPESVRRFLLFYPDLATMLRDARLLAGDDRFDAVQGAIAGRAGGGMAFRLDVAKYFTGRAGRRRPARRPVRRPGAAAADDDRLLRLPQPARRAGGGAAGQRAVVLPASVADDVRR